MDKIIIIGAGIAGLTTAIELAPFFEITVLEARDRLGGRIYTTVASDHQTPIELGATFFEGYGENPFFQKYLSTTPHDNKPFIKKLNLDGSLVFNGDHLDPRQYSMHALKQYYEIAQKEYEQALNSSWQIGKTLEEFVATICHPFQRDKEKYYWVKKFIEYELLHHNTHLSLPGIPSFDKSHENKALDGWNQRDANISFVVGGYDKVIQQMHSQCLNLGVSIKTGSGVIQINDHGVKGVTVITADNQSYFAAKVISTIPIGVLKTQAESLFNPSLSNDKMLAIAAMGVHQATRISLEFGSPFWDNLASPYIFLAKPDQASFTDFRNGYPLHQKAILQSDHYSNIVGSASDVVDTVMKDLRLIFPDAPAPIQSMVYRWSDDIYAQGSYPYRTIYITEALQQALERPEGNIYFAGADFSRYGFSVHHAYASAIRTAQQIKLNFML
ncbi:MAG: flavin monoamine oxidase family protein [Candidatus Berkiellales bacterium]